MADNIEHLQSYVDIKQLENEDRIIRGEISQQEIQTLEERLCAMFVERATKSNTSIEVYTDPAIYQQLRTTGEIFEDHRYCLYLDNHTMKVRDMSPIIMKLLDTPEGLFYGKIMLHRVSISQK